MRLAGVLRKRRRSTSLASEMMMVTVALVGSAVFITGLLALGGVYQLALRESDARLRVYRQVLAGGVESRLDHDNSILEGLTGAEVFRTGADEDISARVDRFALSNFQAVKAVSVLTTGGVTVAQMPRRQSPPESVLATLSAAATDTAGMFLWRAPAKQRDRGTLWAARTVRAGDGRLLLVVLRLRTEELYAVIADTASSSENRSAALLDRSRGTLIAAAEGPGLPAPRIVFEPSDESAETGVARLRDGRLGWLTGYYSDVGQGYGLDWRIVVTEPRRGAWDVARSALVPATLSVLVLSVLAFVVSGAFARRLLTPLREFEVKVRDIERGAYIQPLRVEHEDEVGRLTEVFNAMANRINSLQDLSQLLASASDLDHVLDGILSAIGHLLRTGTAAVFLLDDAGQNLVLARASGVKASTDLSVPVDAASFVAEAFRSAKPTALDAEVEAVVDAAGALFEKSRAVTGMAMPLAYGRDTIGVVVVLAGEHHAFTEADVELARTFTAQAAVAVHNSRLFRKEHVSRREAEALREVAELIAAPEDLDEALARVLDVAVGLLGMESGEVAIGDRHVLGMPHARDPERERAWLTAFDEVFDTQGDSSAMSHPMLVEAAHEHPGIAPLLPEGRPFSVLVVPLLQTGRRRGLMALVSGGAKVSLPLRRAALAETIGKEVSLALSNAYLLHQARTRAANLETVFRISQAVSSSLQANTVLNRVLDVVQKILSADSVSLMRYDPQKQKIVTAMARGVLSNEILFFEVEPGQDIPGSVFSSKRPQWFEELSGERTALAKTALAQGFHSLLAVPLLTRGRSIGVLSVFSQEPDSFSDEDMELLLTFASQAALAIDTAELYGKEHHVASVLQNSIVPEQLPEIPGLETHSVYLPVGGEAEIGGDYYDLFMAPDGRVAIAIADVAGQGVEASTKTSMIKYSVRGMVAAGLGVGRVVHELNRMVCDSGRSQDIVTMWLGYLDAANGSLVYANGGHPPAMHLVSAKGEVDRLEATGPLLGASAEAVFAEAETRLSNRDVVLLFTDGVTEARHAGRFFGEGRVRRALRPGGTAVAVTQRLLSAVNRFAVDGLKDDAAILAVRYVNATD